MLQYDVFEVVNGSVVEQEVHISLIPTLNRVTIIFILKNDFVSAKLSALLEWYLSIAGHVGIISAHFRDETIVITEVYSL